jgi:hypothetical protein
MRAICAVLPLKQLLGAPDCRDSEGPRFQSGRSEGSVAPACPCEGDAHRVRLQVGVLRELGSGCGEFLVHSPCYSTRFAYGQFFTIAGVPSEVPQFAFAEVS